MRDGKGKFYKALKVDKFTRQAIKLYNKIKYIMLRETNYVNPQIIKDQNKTK